MSAADVHYALRQSAIAHQVHLFRRRYDEDASLHQPLDEAEVSRRLLAFQDVLASHMRSRLPALTLDDAERLGALALAIRMQILDALAGQEAEGGEHAAG